MASDIVTPQGLPRGWASDVEVLARTGSVVEDFGDHLVVRTPDNPDYRWGNLLVVRNPGRRDDAEHWLARFADAFPKASHRSIGLPDQPNRDSWTAHGLEVESDEVLTSVQPPRARPPTPGYSVRRLVTASDWAAAADLEIAEEREEASEGDGESNLAAFGGFARRRWASRAAASARGDAAFFGAFERDDQVAQLGIVRCGDHARYQSVITHRRHRERGLAGHLLQVAGAWAADRGATRWVILVEPGSAAARLYRSVGFRYDSSGWQASAM